MPSQCQWLGAPMGSDWTLKYFSRVFFSITYSNFLDKCQGLHRPKTNLVGKDAFVTGRVALNTKWPNSQFDLPVLLDILRMGQSFPSMGCLEFRTAWRTFDLPRQWTCSVHAAELPTILWGATASRVAGSCVAEPLPRRKNVAMPSASAKATAGCYRWWFNARRLVGYDCLWWLPSL